jgi:hypothetical protein
VALGIVLKVGGLNSGFDRMEERWWSVGRRWLDAD